MNTDTPFNKIPLCPMNMFILTCAPFNKTLMYVRFDLWYLNYQLTLKVYCVSVIDTATLIVRLLIFDICILWLSHWVGDWLRPLTSNHKPNAVDVSSVCFFNLSSLSLPPSNRNKSGGRDTDEYYWKWRDDKYQ